MKGCLSAMIVALSFRVERVGAMTASPIPYDDIQPDGSVVSLVLKGDENGHEASDLKGEFTKKLYVGRQFLHYASNDMTFHHLITFFHRTRQVSLLSVGMMVSCTTLPKEQTGSCVLQNSSWAR
jgi:hypothetical protein